MANYEFEFDNKLKTWDEDKKSLSRDLEQHIKDCVENAKNGGGARIDSNTVNNGKRRMKIRVTSPDAETLFHL